MKCSTCEGAVCVDSAAGDLEIGERPVRRGGKDFCPKCGAPAEDGYGLMGGGIGGYEFCTRSGCDWFHKVQDAAEAASAPAPAPSPVPCPHCGLLPDGSGPSLADLRAVRSQLRGLACMPDVQKAVVRVCRWIDELGVGDA